MPATQAPNETRLPRAVLRMGEDVQRRLAERAAQRETGQPPIPPASTASATEAGATPPAAPAPAADPRHDDPRYWEQRFRVTEGLLNVERTARANDAKTAREQIASLQSQITALQASVPATPTDLTRYFTPAQIESFGEEQCRTMATAAEQAARTQAQALIDQHVKPLVDARKSDENRAAQEAKDRLYGALDERYPRWREVDVTQPWKDWLAQIDDATGLPRQNMLNHHIATANVARIAAMFKLFEDASRPPAPPVPPHGSAAPAVEAPPAPASALGPPTKAEINEFYKRAALGKVKPEERVQFEARLAAARQR